MAKGVKDVFNVAYVEALNVRQGAWGRYVVICGEEKRGTSADEGMWKTGPEWVTVSLLFHHVRKKPFWTPSLLCRCSLNGAPRMLYVIQKRDNWRSCPVL